MPYPVAAARGGLGQVSGGGGLTFLLRDDFLVDAAAPLASPRTAEPGPGTLTLVQTDGQLSVSGGKLNFPAQSSAAWGDQGFYGAALSRAAGRALFDRVSRTNTGKNSGSAWSSTSNVGFTASNLESNIILKDAGVIGYWPPGGSDYVNLASYVAATEYQFAQILRSTGAFVFVKGGLFANWTLLWPSNQGSTATLYPIFTNHEGAGTVDFFRVLDLAAPFATDYGLATQRLAGSQIEGQTFVHEANFVLEYTLTTRSSALGSYVRIRQQDANNYWIVEISPAGSFILYESVANVWTQRAIGGVVNSGHRIVIVGDGNTIRGYSNDVLRWTYGSASNFSTATTGRIFLGTGGVISDIVSWPRTLSGAAATLLDAAVA